MFLRRHRDIGSFVHSLRLHYSIRLHAAVLLASATLAGLLVSKALLVAGLEAPVWRFPIAVLASYVLFLLMVEGWLRYIGLRRAKDHSSADASFDLPGGGHGSSGGGRFEGGGGSFDGGGASASFDGATLDAGVDGGAVADLAEAKVGVVAEAGEFAPVALLIVVCIVFAITAGSAVVSVPTVLIETAVEAGVASGLIRALAPGGRAVWFDSLLDRTLWKALALVVAALVIGVMVRWVDPHANTIGEAVARLLGH